MRPRHYWWTEDTDNDTEDATDPKSVASSHPEQTTADHRRPLPPARTQTLELLRTLSAELHRIHQHR